jgi:hypothetical protein
MQNQELIFNFDNNEVKFEVVNGEIMVNATQLAKIYNKRIDNFLVLDNTENYIKALLETFETRIENFEEKNNENSSILPIKVGRIALFDEKIQEKNPIRANASKSMIIQNRSRSGTWFHQLLALKFAAWLNPRFEVWVYMTISNILNKNNSKIDQAKNSSIEIKREIVAFETKREKVIEKLESNKSYQELKELDHTISTLKNKLKAIQNNTIELIFNENNLFSIAK